MYKYAESLTGVRKKVTHTHELISTSHHEAGHVIYALLHFIMIHSVRVFYDKKTKRIGGFTYYDSLDYDTFDNFELMAERLNSEIGLLYAGLVSEKYQYKLHSGSDKFPSFLDGSSKDLKDASEVIKKYNIALPGRKRYNYKKHMIRRVTRELLEHWDAVTVVAHALFQKKRLSFNDLKNILIKKTEHKEFWKERMKAIKIFYDKPDVDEKEFMSLICKFTATC
jgi:hypothetical protein